MSSINLNIVGAETFGARLPTVFIQSLELSEYDPSSASSTSYRLKAVLTIKFTKPPHLQFGSTTEFINDYLGSLSLYAYITTDTDRFPEALSTESLDLLEWHKHVEAHNELEVNPSIIEFEERLHDLIAGDAGASLLLNNSYDGNGNEIIEISNITCYFSYAGGRESGSWFERFESINLVDNSYFFAMVGSHMPTLSGVSNTDTFAGPYADAAEGELAGAAKTYSSQTYNSFFGNITYYHIMERGIQTSRYYRQYTLPSGSPYLNDVLQSINGKFYATDDYGHSDIKSRIETIANEFSSERTGDPILNKNISDLEAIILSVNNKVNMLGEMATYRSTYPNKDQATASGRFYNSFIIAYSEILASVQSQAELSQKLYLDTLLVDLRLNQMGGSFSYPTLPDFERGEEGVIASNDYIPSNWFQIARQAHSIKPLHNTKFDGDIYMDSSDLDASSEGYIESALGGAGTGVYYGEYRGQYNGLYEAYKDAGLSDEIADELARAELELSRTTSMHSHGADGSAEVFDLFELSDSYGITTDLNFIVQNKGIFFFDYEKALRTESIISKAINLTKIQQYFRRSVPYSCFYVQKVELIREEVYIGVATGDSGHDSIKCTIFADFASPPKTATGGFYHNYDSTVTSTPHSPAQKSTGLGWEADPTSSGAITDIELYRFNYMRPVANTTGTTDTVSMATYLKMKDFDVAVTDSSKRLDGFNNLSVLPSYDNSGTVYDGYRLMCFEYSDLMDDDIAYYNASSVHDIDEYEGEESRAAKLRNLNVIDCPRTVYKIKVTAIDNSKTFLDDFYDYLAEIYEEYLEYTVFAEEICSYNNITNSYNQFFIEGITEKYGNSLPWIRAAYAFTALADILYNPSETSADSLNYMVMDKLSKISPSTGTLTGTIEAANQFLNLLSMIGPRSMPATYDPSPLKKLFTDSDEKTTLHFYNEIDFGQGDTGMICGNFYPDFEGADSLVGREVAPFPIIPKFAFMGGRTGRITEGAGGEDSTETELTGYRQIYAGVVGETAIKTFSRETVLGDIESGPSAGSMSMGEDGRPMEGSDELAEIGFVSATGEVDRGTLVDYGAGAEIDILDPFATNTLRIAYDEIFLPYGKHDWRYILLNISDKTWLRTEVTESGDTDSIRYYETAGVLISIHPTPLLDDKPTDDAYIGTYAYSNAAKLCHEILMRSSQDVIMNAAGTKAKRKGDGISPVNRRDHRQLSDLSYLISELYIPEAIRRINDPETAAKFRYSTIVRRRQNYQGFEYGDMGTNIHNGIKILLEAILEAINAELSNPTNDTDEYADSSWPIARARGDLTYGDHAATEPLRGISDIVSYYDYPGNTKLFVEYED